MARSQVLSAILLYSLSSAVGQNFVYFTLTQFNPLVLTTVTTTRKIFSTLFSVFRNPENSLSPMQWGGTSLVFAGLIVKVIEQGGRDECTTSPNCCNIGEGGVDNSKVAIKFV